MGSIRWYTERVSYTSLRRARSGRRSLVQSDDRHWRSYGCIRLRRDLTPEEILLRFKKVMGREMTPEEKHRFFLVEAPEALSARLNLSDKS
ncbi:MAG: hypothetical protein JWQ87_1023 [Candidatus Sulfotelmatobacter sp.]|nr:hypothetical protein [Candidatus Sulfotelmatobacter sp.]